MPCKHEIWLVQEIRATLTPRAYKTNNGMARMVDITLDLFGFDRPVWHTDVEDVNDNVVTAVTRYLDGAIPAHVHALANLDRMDRQWVHRNFKKSRRNSVSLDDELRLTVHKKPETGLYRVELFGHANRVLLRDDLPDTVTTDETAKAEAESVARTYLTYALGAYRAALAVIRSDPDILSWRT